MNKAYLMSLASYQCINMTLYLILSSILKDGSLGGAAICFAIGVLIHRYTYNKIRGI